MALDRFRSESLMGLVRNYRRLAWVIAYLFGASPVVAKSFRPSGHPRLESLDDATWYAPFATSLRMSDLGYRNSTQARLSISANSLDEYVAELKAAVSTPDPRYAAIGVEVDGEYRQLNTNRLQIENEYYCSIRPKPRDRSLRVVTALARDGIEYVEVRNLDSDPTLPVGVGTSQMCLIELLLLHCLLADSPPIDEAEQAEIDARELTVAWEGRRPGQAVLRNGTAVTLREWGSELADALDVLAEALEADEYVAAARQARAGFADPQRLPSALLVDTLTSRGVSFLEYGLELAQRHRNALLGQPLPADRERALAAAAGESLLEARRLEAQPAVPFALYLQARSGL